MRILIASSTYKPSMNGQAVFTTNLAEGLVQRGHEVMVLLDSHHVHASTTWVNGVRLEELKSISLTALHAGVYFSPFPRTAVRRLFDEFQPEIVHIQDHYPTCQVVVSQALKNNIKIVGSNHYIPDNVSPYIPAYATIRPLANRLLWRWMMNVYEHADVITAQSRAAGELIRQQGYELPVLPISCGIDLDIYHPDPLVDRQMYRKKYGIDPEKKIFLFLGRIDGEKRIDLLLHAIPLLKHKGVQVVIAGHGSIEKQLMQLATSIGLDGEVRFPGFIPAADVPGLMNSVDVFVMPSEAELLSISTLEAMACNRPVLLANALALPELVREGENGYLFRPGDKEDLAQHMDILLNEEERWTAMGHVSRQIAHAHSLEDTLDAFERLYEQLANQEPVTEVELELNTQV